MSLAEHEARIILSINKAVASIFDLDELLQRLADIVSEAVHFSRVAIDLSDRSGEVTIRAVHGYPEELTGRPFDLLSFNPNFTRVLSGEVLIYDYDDPALPKASRSLLESTNTLRVINVPIMRANRFLGIIVADEPGVKHEFTEEEIRLIVAIADQASMAIENARLYEEQKYAAAEIGESRKQVLDILESISDGFFALDNDWRFTYVNTKAAELIGKRREALLFRNMWEVVPQLAGTIFETEYRRAKEEMAPVSFEARYPPIERWLEVRVYPYENGLSVYTTDITDRKSAEEALAESERRFREILEEASLVAVMLDTHGQVTFANEFLLELTGWSENEIIGRDWFDLFIPSQEREELRKGFFESIAQGTIFPHHVNDILTKRGEHRTISYSNIILRDTKGRVIGTASFGEDVTGRKMTERQ